MMWVLIRITSPLSTHSMFLCSLVYLHLSRVFIREASLPAGLGKNVNKHVTPITAKLQVDRDLTRSERKSFGCHIGKIRFLRSLGGHFLSYYIDSNIHFCINYALSFRCECFNSLEVRICSKILKLSYECRWVV